MNCRLTSIQKEEILKLIIIFLYLENLKIKASMLVKKIWLLKPKQI